MRFKIFFVVMLCIPFVALEIFFRLLPVNNPPKIREVNEKNPVARFQPDRNYLWSHGWNFDIITRKSTNNLGFVNDSDYVRSDLDPLMVVIGDSYVEAQQVANAESVSGVLAEKVGHAGRVYSLGLSGAALSQYLVFAEYAKNKLSAGSMVFIIVGNDFKETLLKYESAPRFHYFEEKDGHYELKRIDYEMVGPIKKTLRKSAFVRYIMLNLEIKRLLEPQPSYPKDMPSQFVGNIPRNASNQWIKDSESAVDEFFRQLPFKSGLGANNILLVLDGMRPDLYSDQGLRAAEGSFYDHMRSYFTMTAERLGYEVKDMQPVFIEKNRHDGSTFEFENEGHWNQLGHKLAAGEIASSDVYKRTFSKTPDRIHTTREVALIEHGDSLKTPNNK